MPVSLNMWNPRLMGLILVIIAPALVLLVETARDAYRDTIMIRTATLRNEIELLRNQLARRAGRLEEYLESSGSDAEISSGPLTLATIDRPKLLANWESSRSAETQELYWALVDPHGLVVLHSDESYSGKRLTSSWDDVKQPNAGDNVVKVHQAALSGDRDAYDVNIPLFVQGQEVGSLHSGLDTVGIDHHIVQQQRAMLWERVWIISLLALVSLSAVGGVVYLARCSNRLQAALQVQQDSASRKLAQIGLGLAHEIRNPLHALRLNTHTLRRSLAGKALSETEMAEMMRESCDEIDRLDSLMRALVQYVAPQSREPLMELELDRETQAILQLQSEEMRRRNVGVSLNAEKALLVVRAAPSQIRAVLHELFTFAQRSAGEGGKIDIQLRALGDSAELLIKDTGRELSASDLEKLFEPFHATPYSEAGLRLALIRQYVNESGGRLIRCQSTGANRFVLRLPLTQQTAKGSSP